jgi:hypothetical protein
MQETLQLKYSFQRRENRRKESPLKRVIIFLAVLIGIAVAIAAHSKKEPPRYIATA